MLKLFKTSLIISGLAGLLSLSLFYSSAPTVAQQTGTTALTGFAWSSNIGWISFNSSNPSSASFISADGGEITYIDKDGRNPRSTSAYEDGYTVHTFRGNGTFTPDISGEIEYYVIAGGGGGGCAGGGGGGAGGYRTGKYDVDAGTDYQINIGQGGSAIFCTNGGYGGNSSIVANGSTIVLANGGGFGGSCTHGTTGGSGGGGGACGSSPGFGYGMEGQGHNGYGASYTTYGSIKNPRPFTTSGGGGGAGSAATSWNGGDGITLFGNVCLAGGGGAGATAGFNTYGEQGSANCGGGFGGYNGPASGAAPNTGGGGGGGGNDGVHIFAGGPGGSGIVIIRYPSAILVPKAPTIGKATVLGNGKVSVTVTHSVQDDPSTITGYTIISNPGNFSVTSLTSPVVMDGLRADGTMYNFTAKAINAIGPGVSSEPSNYVIPRILEASGGIITYTDSAGNIKPTQQVGGYTIHTFTKTNTNEYFNSGNVKDIEYFVIGGGGGGGYSIGGGGGAGGYLHGIFVNDDSVSYQIKIGKGGTGGLSGGTRGANGTDSSIVGIITATGGGGGGTYSSGTGSNGGSGGGGAPTGFTPGYGGSGITGQGNGGGTGTYEEHQVITDYDSEGNPIYGDLVSSGQTGGGGGAASGANQYNGGQGVTLFDGICRAGGGGGGNYQGGNFNGDGYCGGGNGGRDSNGGSAAANTGGGGGGAGNHPSYPYYSGGPGGSGIVILRYRN